MTDQLGPASELSVRLRAAATRWPHPNPQELNHLERALRRLSPAVQFAVLVEPFEVESGYVLQEYAGRLLARIQPDCPRPLRDVLSSTLSHWDVSVEQFPHYLAAVFGHQVLLDALVECEALAVSDRELRAIETFRFWLRTR